MSIPNVNPNTGIAYGVISGNNVPELLDDIISNGDNITYEAWKKELEQEIRNSLFSIFNGRHHDPNRIVDHCGVDEIVEAALDAGLNDEYQNEEEEYVYEASYVTSTTPIPTGVGYPTAKFKLQLGWLGGAPLIWIIESPFKAYAPHCSPCVPNAGDLNNMHSDDSGVLCYCLSPEDLSNDSNGKFVADENLIVRPVSEESKNDAVV